MINVAVKIFVTYAAISMTLATFLFFLEAAHVINPRSPAPFIILWMGPLMMATSIGVPYGIYRFWSGL